MILHEELLRLVRYEPDTGKFYWIGERSGRVHSGIKQAGCLHPDGYMKLRFGPKLYRAAHLAVFYMSGVYPETVDHVNRVRDDDRYVNLRVCTRSQNQANRPAQANNRSGYKGVFWSKQARKWIARVQFKGNPQYFGSFETAAEAGHAAAEGRKKLHGEFAHD